MNERIKKILEQVGGYGTTALMHPDDVEKFAELIVEEVYDYILNATFNDEPWPSSKDVKQHFGVE